MFDITHLCQHWHWTTFDLAIFIMNLQLFLKKFVFFCNHLKSKPNCIAVVCRHDLSISATYTDLFIYIDNIHIYKINIIHYKYLMMIEKKDKGR